MDTKFDIGVKYADKQARNFDDEKIKAGQCVIGLQVTITNDNNIIIHCLMVTFMAFKVTLHHIRIVINYTINNQAPVIKHQYNGQ